MPKPNVPARRLPRGGSVPEPPARAARINGGAAGGRFAHEAVEIGCAEGTGVDEDQDPCGFAGEMVAEIPEVRDLALQPADRTVVGMVVGEEGGDRRAEERRVGEEG